jgi:hypothetical protein
MVKATLGLTLAAEAAADLADAEAHGDAAAAAQVIRRSFAARRAAIDVALRSLRGAAGVVELPALHTVIVRAPRSELEHWLARGAADGLVSTVAATRGRRIGSPIARRPGSRHEAVTASFAPGKSTPASVAARAGVGPIHDGEFRGGEKEIGLLDTGVEPAADKAGFRIAGYARFDPRGGLTAETARDHGTHGTQMASVLRAVCPDADLAVASVLQAGGGAEGATSPKSSPDSAGCSTARPPADRWRW